MPGCYSTTQWAPVQNTVFLMPEYKQKKVKHTGRTVFEKKKFTEGYTDNMSHGKLQTVTKITDS